MKLPFFLKINPHFQSVWTKLDAYEATDAAAATGSFLLLDSCWFDSGCATRRVAPLKKVAGRPASHFLMQRVAADLGCRWGTLTFFKAGVRIKGTVSSLSSLPAAETLRQQNARGENLKRGIEKVRTRLWVRPWIIPRWVYRSQMPSTLFFLFFFLS